MIRKIEKNILNNLTIFSIVLILIFSALQIGFFLAGKNFLEIKDFITLLGAIFVFWYGYKRYERDKELEMIDKYVLGSLTINNINDLEKYGFCYTLYAKGYISLWIWEKISYNNEKIIFNFLYDNFFIKDDIDKQALKDKIKIIKEIIFFDKDFAKYFFKYINNIINEIDEDKFKKANDRDKNVAKNLKALLISINDANKEFNINFNI